MDRKKRLLWCLLLVLPLCSLHGQEGTTDLLEQGMDLLHKQHNACAAYPLLMKFVDNLPEKDRHTERHALAIEQIHICRIHVSKQLEDWFEQAMKYQRKGDRVHADSLFIVYFKNSVTPESRKTRDYADVLMQVARQLSRTDLDSCATLFLQAAQVYLANPETPDIYAGEAYSQLAGVYHDHGFDDKAIQVCEEALALFEKRYGKKHHYYGTVLSNVAAYYASRNNPGDRAKAIQLTEAAVGVLKKGSKERALALNSLVVFYSQIGDFVKADQISKEAIKAARKLQESSTYLATILSNQSVQLSRIGNYEQAMAYATEAQTIYEANGETSSLNFAKLLTNMASLHKRAERYEQAIALWERASTIYERIEGKNSAGYLSCMTEISSAYNRTGNLEQATNVNERLQHTLQQSNTNDERWAISLLNQARNYANEGNYAQAVVLQQQALSTFVVRNDSLKIGHALKDLSNTHHLQGDTQAAIDTCLKAISIYHRMPQAKEYEALAYNDLSIYYHTLGRQDEAMRTGEEALRLYEQSGNMKTSFFADLLNNQAYNEAHRDNYKKAISMSRRAVEIQREVLGEEHPNLILSLYNEAYYYLKDNQVDSAQQCLHLALQHQIQQVRRNFSHLTTQKREHYWSTKRYIFNAVPLMACMMQGNDSILVDAYNALLFTKGLLLNSEVDFMRLLRETASPELQQQYAQLKALQEQINTIYLTSEPEALASVPALQDEASRLERAVVMGSREYGDFTENLSITYNQVADALDDDEAAIEFFDYSVQDKSHTFMALLTRKGWSVPKLIQVVNLDDAPVLRGNQGLMQALSSEDGVNELFNNPAVGQLIWNPLMPYLEGVRNVYFSPSGLLFKWGIEYLRYDEQRRIGDIFSIHRLSSTKQLVKRTTHARSLELAAIFGGLNYETTSAMSQVIAQQHLTVPTLEELDREVIEQQSDTLLAQRRGLQRMLRTSRGAIEYLDGTLSEVETIDTFLLKQQIKTELYTDSRGTEEAFKALSGRQIPLIHIATHGFTLNDDNTSSWQEATNLMEILRRPSIDNSLSYSGLLMAGSNTTIKGIRLPSTIEDGILTAQEIAGMDLQGLELVVLSACQTGLGQLKDDGVFGLQRGFKKAGAHTLLMSLWSVDDHATQVMMTQFYQHLMLTHNRFLAFRQAQQAMREMGYNDPFYWASFIMLDD